MVNPLDLLNAITYTQKVEAIIRSGADMLLISWRDAAPGKTDDEILRSKLIECGWKYSRQKGRWHHPDAEDYSAPLTLKALAESMSQHVMREALRKERESLEGE